MQTKTIKTPIVINIYFLILLLLPIAILSIVHGKVNCRYEYNYYTIGPIDPLIQKKCQKKWDWYTRMEIRQFNLK